MTAASHGRQRLGADGIRPFHPLSRHALQSTSQDNAKLDQIDRRLQAWRDQEIMNRLRIIKITLVASILAAMLSLGYKYLDRLLGRPTSQDGPQPTTQRTVEEPDA